MGESEHYPAPAEVQAAAKFAVAITLEAIERGLCVECVGDFVLLSLPSAESAKVSIPVQGREYILASPSISLRSVVANAERTLLNHGAEA